MVKVTNKMKTLTKTEQASIHGGRTCADACSDSCVGVCNTGGNLDSNTALQWFWTGISDPDNSFPTP